MFSHTDIHIGHGSYGKDLARMCRYVIKIKYQNTRTTQDSLSLANDVHGEF